MPDKHFDPPQNLTGKRYLQICFDWTYGRIRRAFLQLKTYKKTYARPYFWLEVTGLGQSRYRDTSTCARRASRAYIVKLKAILCSEPILKWPNFEREFILQTDASERGIGAVLSQYDDQGLEHPLAYSSRKLIPWEQ